jgi:hypothetical protein
VNGGLFLFHRFSRKRRKNGPPLQWAPWLLATDPTVLTTYVPQVGDEIVYFRAAHERYLSKYPEKLPDMELKPFERFIVVSKSFQSSFSYFRFLLARRHFSLEINYIVANPSFCEVTLKQVGPTVDPASDAPIINLSYHVTQDMDDFFVLASSFQHSISIPYRAGYRVRMWFERENRILTGKIRENRSLTSMESYYECLVIDWDETATSSTTTTASSSSAPLSSVAASTVRVFFPRDEFEISLSYCCVVSYILRFSN